MPIEKLIHKEIEFLIKLVEAEKMTIGFLRGFAKPSDEEQKIRAEYNKLINKLKALCQ